MSSLTRSSRYNCVNQSVAIYINANNPPGHSCHAGSFFFSQYLPLAMATRLKSFGGTAASNAAHFVKKNCDDPEIKVRHRGFIQAAITKVFLCVPSSWDYSSPCDCDKRDERDGSRRPAVRNPRAQWDEMEPGAGYITLLIALSFFHTSRYICGTYTIMTFA